MLLSMKKLLENVVDSVTHNLIERGRFLTTAKYRNYCDYAISNNNKHE